MIISSLTNIFQTTKTFSISKILKKLIQISTINLFFSINIIYLKLIYIIKIENIQSQEFQISIQSIRKREILQRQTINLKNIIKILRRIYDRYLYCLSHDADNNYILFNYRNLESNNTHRGYI